MNKHRLRLMSIVTILLFVGIAVLELDAFARAGGGRSFGGRGTRSFSTPSRQYSNPSPSRQQTPAQGQPTPAQPPAGGGFLRTFGGGLMGGLLGGMLFSSLGFGGMHGGLGGSGFGIFEILLVVGIGFLVVKMVKAKKRENSLSHQTSYQQPAHNTGGFPTSVAGEPGHEDVTSGISHIRQMDPSFDEGRFRDTASDIFFKMQAAWMNKNLAPVNNLLTDDMKDVLQRDIDRLRAEKRTNRLENIAVRSVEIVEAWQEAGQDFLTVLFVANLLDYATDDSSGEVLEGSKTDPVRFEEFWTFTRTLGNNPWKLTAINQP